MVNGKSMLKKLVYIYLLLGIFTIYIYKFTSKEDWQYTSTDTEHNFFNLFYFTNTSLTSCGYGDIYPKTNNAKIPVMVLQTILIFQVLSFFS